MTQYIDKSDLVAKIEKETKTLRQEIPSCENKEHKKGKLFGLQRALYLIDTLGVKEVNLEKEIDNYFDNYKLAKKEECWLNHDQTHIFAKHFFELGLNASNPLTWEDIKLIWTIGDEMPYMPEEDFFKELLKRFKAQKGGRG